MKRCLDSSLLGEMSANDAESILKPLLEKFFVAANSANWDAVEDFYHPNGVAVQTDKEAVFGRSAIIASYKKFAEGTGKSTASISNDKYEGSGDYLVITADFSADTEKAGVVKGKFVQIWKKSGDRHLIYHDEFEMTP